MVKPENIYAEYIAEKLNYQPYRFKELMAEKDYPAAKYCHDTTAAVVTFLELPEEVKKAFFGNRPYVEDEEDVTDGLFPEELVQKAYLECAVKRSQGRENRTYVHPMKK